MSKEDPFDFSTNAHERSGYAAKRVNHAMDVAALTVLGDPEVTGKNITRRTKQPNHYERVKRWATDRGYWCFKVERLVYDPRTSAMRKQDLLGFADMLAVKPGPEILAIQVTTQAAIRAHVRKFVDDNAMSGGESVAASVRRWLDCGCRLVILGYHKPGHTWACEEVEVTQDLLDKAIQQRRKQ